ncbi:hypothetical protein KKF84_04485, partial [Myxococcota bacterium]|nr:hypothetical protein [Myxococcota bacterium]
MIKKITLLSLLTAIFAFGTVTACKQKKRHKRHKSYKKHKGEGKKQCKKLYKEILEQTSYTKDDIKKMYGSKDSFIGACKAGKDGGPFKKLLKCRKKDEKLAKCGKKHLAILFGKKIVKDKGPKADKPKTDKPKADKPKADDEDGKDGAFKNVEKLGEAIFKIAAKGDFEAMKKMMVTPADVKDIDNGTLFKKFANEKKFKSKFEEWVKMFKDNAFKSVKAKDDEKKTVKPGEKVKKLQELTASIKKEVTVWNVNIKAEKGGKITKCAFAAIQLGEKW